MQRDKYDVQIEKLLDYSAETLESAWLGGQGIFQFASPTGAPRKTKVGRCGCLTMIRGCATSVAWTPQLTEEIRADTRLPCNMTHFKQDWVRWTRAERRKHLQVFAEWQRRLDKEIREVAA